jgi:hypothetical protein
LGNRQNPAGASAHINREQAIDNRVWVISAAVFKSQGSVIRALPGTLWVPGRKTPKFVTEGDGGFNPRIKPTKSKLGFSPGGMHFSDLFTAADFPRVISFGNYVDILASNENTMICRDKK